MGTSIAKYDHVAVLVVKDDLAGEALEDFCVRTEQCMAEGCYCLVVDTSLAACRHHTHTVMHRDDLDELRQRGKWRASF